MRTEIRITLDNGDQFKYGGTKDIDGILNHLRFQSPTWIKCKDEFGDDHIFHSSSVKHIVAQYWEK